jgi:nucleoside-diphosphate-sugar epimerase
MASPAGENEDFNISASQELTIAELAAMIWSACGEDPEAFTLSHQPTFTVDVQRRWPSVAKARDLLGWTAQVELAQGLADTVAWLRDQHERLEPETR